MSLEIQACFCLLPSRNLLCGQERQEVVPDPFPVLAMWGWSTLPLSWGHRSQHGYLGQWGGEGGKLTHVLLGRGCDTSGAAKHSCYLGFLGEKYLGDCGICVLFLKNISLMHPITAWFLLLGCLVLFFSQLSTALRRWGVPEMFCTAGVLPSAESWTRRPGCWTKCSILLPGLSDYNTGSSIKLQGRVGQSIPLLFLKRR